MDGSDHAPLRVAFDVGPLYGHGTGVATAVRGMLEAIGPLDAVAISPYLTSFRSRPAPGHRRLGLPAGLAVRLWARADHPRADRWLGEIDLIHGTNYVAPPSAYPAVVSVYDCWFLRHADEASPAVRRAGQVLRRAVRRGAWVHASSEATAQGVRELLATDCVATVLLGPPDVGDRPGARPPIARELGARPFIVAIGTEERRKGYPLLVDAFGRMRDSGDDIALVLAGAEGDDSPTIGRAIDALPRTASVHRLGRIDEPTRAWLLRQASVVAYPSLDEGFGFPVLEAQMTGTPIVATNVGSVPEVAGSAAQLVTGRDPDDFAAALATVLTDGTRRLELIEAGYRNRDRFSWARTADGLVDLYRTACRHGAGARNRT